jgi:cytochrome c oxidase cbb3-type subunit 4
MSEFYATLQPILPTLWVVWFFILFTGIVVYVMAPWRKRRYEQLGDIPLRDEAPAPGRR